MNNHPEVQLAPPGAGLPAFERLIGQTLLRFRRRFSSRQSHDARYHNERARIRASIRGLDADTGAIRVLIPRLRGLEDSSRFWSVWMTLDHLRIVNDSMRVIVEHLVRGQVPAGEASTARVKPAPVVDVTIVARYEASCDAYLNCVSQARDLNSVTRFPHPWFGPMDATGWHVLAGAHLGIHRRQIDLILTQASVPRNGPAKSV